jgi:hypothetical protein
MLGREAALPGSVAAVRTLDVVMHSDSVMGLGWHKP